MITPDRILENIGVALIVCDEQLAVQCVNSACENLLGISRRYLVKRSLAQVVTTDANLQAMVKRSLNNDSRYTLREIELHNTGEVEVDITITPMTFDNGECYVSLELSRTDRINRLARENSNVEQQKTNRLIMRSLSHEIKNPLSGLRGAAQLLDAELVNPELKEFTGIIIKESDRLTNLVNRVMGSHRQYASKPVNIHYVIEHIARLVAVSEGSDVVIQRDYDPSLPEFVGDVEQMIQAVLNVVKNAIEVQTKQTNATVGFRTRLERNFTIDKRLHRNLIKLQIWDKGPGVPDELTAILFNPMITGRAEGTGLGLAIAQEIIQRHEGLINLEKYQDYTCFAIYLPLQLGHRQERS